MKLAWPFQGHVWTMLYGSCVMHITYGSTVSHDERSKRKHYIWGGNCRNSVTVASQPRPSLHTIDVYFLLLDMFARQWSLYHGFSSSRGIAFQSEEESAQNASLRGAGDHSLRFHRLRAAHSFQRLFDTISREHFINSARSHHYHPRSLQHLDNI